MTTEGNKGAIGLSARDFFSGDSPSQTGLSWVREEGVESAHASSFMSETTTGETENEGVETARTSSCVSGVTTGVTEGEAAAASLMRSMRRVERPMMRERESERASERAKALHRENA